MIFQNPITKEVFKNQAGFVDSLAETWREIQKQKQPISEAEQKLIEVMDGLVGHPEIEIGTLTLDGEELVVKIRRDQNAKYKKGLDGQNEVQKLIDKTPFLRELFRQEVRESGRKVHQILERFEDHPEEFKETQKKILQKLMELRIVNPARPQIKVVEKTK